MAWANQFLIVVAWEWNGRDGKIERESPALDPTISRFSGLRLWMGVDPAVCGAPLPQWQASLSLTLRSPPKLQLGPSYLSP